VFAASSSLHRAFDAKTCSDTCRKRLQRGQRGHDLAYLASLSAKERRQHRAYHAGFDAKLVIYREAKARELKERRERSEARAAEKRDRFLVELMGRKMLKQQRAQQHQELVSNINGVVKFFTQEHREITVEAIVEFLAPDERYSLEFVTEALDELRASGDYARTIAGEW